MFQSGVADAGTAGSNPLDLRLLIRLIASMFAEIG
jgi:hypothetical protein